MQEIVEELARLKRLDPEFKVFGAVAHRYELQPSLTEDEILRFEAFYRCRLPAEYREFISTIGNGGAGPHYGLFPLGMQDDGYDLAYWNSGYKLVGDPAASFRLDGHWNMSSTFWGQRPDFDSAKSDEEEQKMHDEWDAKLEKEYFAPGVMDGAIPICHEGCALRDWLVLNGGFEGTVWRDCRAEEDGISPIIGKNGKPVSFRAWYLEWLSTSMKA